MPIAPVAPPPTPSPSATWAAPNLVPSVVSPPKVEPDGHDPEPQKQTEWAISSALGQSPEGNDLPHLPKLYTSLARLMTGERDDSVRITWLGDSHTQPDIWTHAVRKPLEQLAGVGGPGFVHVGWKKWGYQHAGVALRVKGRWRIQPPGLLSIEPYHDGVLGLGGVRLLPSAGASAGLQVDPKALPGAGNWELALRALDKNARLIVRPEGAEPIEVKYDPNHLTIRHVHWKTQGPGGGFDVQAGGGRIELFGVVVEAQDPGVVFDVLGLNGARIVHALTWDEVSWKAALARRRPDLIVLAYGSNEAGIRNLSMDRHRKRMIRLLDRARAAAPNSECLIVGAMDRGGAAMSEKIERMNEAQAAAAKDRGCAFWSAQKAMGGRNSMQAWMNKEPAWGASDKIHLKVRGYQQLGGMLARDILSAYRAGVNE